MKLDKTEANLNTTIPVQGNGSKEKLPVNLTEGEKVQLAVMIEKLNLLQGQLALMQRGTADLITSIVTARGLDPKDYGVNLAAGMVLPVAVEKK